MSREAFEAWERDNHITFVSRSSGQYTTDTVSRDALRNLWQAATAAALEEAAEVCEKEIDPEWPNDDISLQAQACADAIRALKEKE